MIRNPPLILILAVALAAPAGRAVAAPSSKTTPLHTLVDNVKGALTVVGRDYLALLSMGYVGRS